MTKRKFKSDAFESIHESAESLHQTGVINEATLREIIAAGMNSLRAGKGTDGEAFMAELETELAARRSKSPPHM
jgi:DNA-binding transcriptional regulator YiaG